MLANTFSHGMIRNYVVGFGTLFNNIKINRRSSSGESASTIAVPLSYAPRQRYIERITEDYNLDKPVAMSLPRMSFELMQVQYSTERKLNTMQRYKRPTTTSNTKIDVVYSPVPYDFTFQLNIYISSIEDGTHIVEQILPYFTPEFTISLKGATDINIPMDLPIVLNAVNMEDSYEGGFDDRRIIIWTMDFTLKGNLFGPITQAGVINKSIINMIPQMNTAITSANSSFPSSTAERLITQPATFVNSTSTTSRALSVDPSLIYANSDFGIAQDIFTIHQDPANYKVWNFESPEYGVADFESANSSMGLVTIDNWRTIETDSTANGTVALSIYKTSNLSLGNVLRHTIVKDTTVVNDIQENVTIQIFANTSGFQFEPFYGKNYRTIELTYSTQQTVGAGGTLAPQGEMKWLTTNSGEGKSFTTGQTEGSSSRFHRATTTTGHPTATATATSVYKYTWDMTKYTTGVTPISDWENRIITALEFTIQSVSDTSGESTVVTDIDNIKIST
jgi:hypothetical protein